MQKKLLVLLIFLLAIPFGCAPQPRPLHPWGAALRALDPANTPTPAHDITAIYLRQQGETLQIRVDLLDFQNPKNLSIDIRIEDDSAPQAPPLTIHIPSQSDIPRILLDPGLATVIIDIPLSEIPAHPRVDVSTPEEVITGLTLDSPIPTQTASLLLTFSDTFAGRLPAEALRRWDGAHSGPRGERHGLKHLLDAAEEYQIPIVLLDLKTPENLSALDAMGVLPKIELLESQKLLILPENNDADLQFVHLEDSMHLYHPLFGKTTYIPIAVDNDASQPTTYGPSLEVRRALLETAINTDNADILVLGGRLATSTWGSPDMVGAALAYFASRPYIRFLNAADLQAFSTKADNAIIPQPAKQEDIRSLQIQSALDFARAWAEAPISNPTFHCQADLPTDLPDCVLENNTYLAIFESQSATLKFLFARKESKPQQLIGPVWQVAPGIDLYPGAFADDKDYTPVLGENTLIFKSTDGTRTKSFSLTESGLEVGYRTREPVIAEIPLLVDPDTRFTPGWAERYAQENTPNGIRWGLGNGLMVSVQAEGLVKMRAFNESLALLGNPEDPDLDYPPGHFVPFPMAVVEVEMRDSYFLRLARLP